MDGRTVCRMFCGRVLAWSEEKEVNHGSAFGLCRVGWRDCVSCEYSYPDGCQIQNGIQCSRSGRIAFSDTEVFWIS